MDGLQKHFIEGNIERTQRRGRRRKQLLGELKRKERILEMERGSTALPFGEFALVERGCGPAVRQTAG